VPRCDTIQVSRPAFQGVQACSGRPAALCTLVVIVFFARSAAAATDWQLKPSFKYDALCLLNALSGDPYYLKYYQAEYDHFYGLFSADDQKAFVTLRRVIKEDGHGIISAKLALYFSAVNDETLPDMIRTAHDSTKMRAALERTPYGSADDWTNYEVARPALESALRALQHVDFAAYWERLAKPRVERRIAELVRDLPKFDISPAIGRYLGSSSPPRTVTVYLLNYSEPHGIRITGLRFLTHVSYPFTTVVRNAVHESMHPPFGSADARLQNAMDTLGRDPLIVDKVEHHDLSLGYNTPAGYIDEDSVQALEQIVTEQLGVGRDPCRYWREQDGGMHVLAAAIYAGYRPVASTSLSPEPFREWFIRAVSSGELLGRSLQERIRAFFASSDCERAK
jgi:hypothetical protein